jgi:hypothetical protein
MYILEVNKRTLFAKFLEVYPECSFLIEDQPKLYPLICLESSCHRAQNCMNKLANRVKAIFDAFPESQLLVLYFKYRDAPNRLRAGIFWKDMREPYFRVLNPGAWDTFKRIGTVYEWELPMELRLGG